MEETIPKQSQINPPPRVFVRYAGQGQCRSCSRETTLAMVFVSENPQAQLANGPWCQECCEQWLRFNRRTGNVIYQTREQIAAETFRLERLQQQQKQALVHLGLPNSAVCAFEIHIQPIGRTDAPIEVGQGTAPAMRTCFHCSQQYPADAERHHNCLGPKENREQEIAYYNHTLRTLHGVVRFSSEELAGVTDRQEFRRLLSAKIQVVGDSVLRLWEVGQERQERREENRRSGTVSGLGQFEIQEKENG